MTSRWTVSPALPADYPAFARLLPELGVPDPTPSADRFARTIARDALVVRDGDEILGYLWARPRGDRLHVVHVITDPAHRGRGVGRALMLAIAERARAAGFRRWMLNVKPENVAARALYERCGMRVAFASVAMHLAWTDVERMEVPTGIVALSLAPADDARFEDALALLRGEVASQRALEGRVLLGAEGAAGAVGIAAFDPNHSGAGLFRVRAPEHVRALLDGIRPYALPAHDHLHLLVEGDPALEAALAAAGATVLMPMLRMEGEIPDRP